MMNLHWSMKHFALATGVLMATGCPGDDASGEGTGTPTTTTTGASTTGAETPAEDTTGDDSTTDDSSANASTSGGEAPPFGGPDDVALAEQLWMDIQGRDAWPQPADFEGIVTSMAPHADFARYTLNETAANDQEFPNGSIIVKDNVSDMEGETLVAVTVMMKMDGYEPTAGDWFWAKYLPDGSLDMNPAGIPLAGRVGLGGDMGCIPCHGGADDDFVFFND